MRKRTAAGIIAATMLLPLSATYSNADEAKLYSIDNAAEKMKKQDYNSQITAGNATDLSQRTQQYQAQFVDELEELQEKNDDYQNINTKLQAEMNAYNNLYNFWLLNESLKVNEQNVELAKDEYQVVLSKRKRGIVSDMEVLQAEIKVNNAIAEVEDSKANLQEMQVMLNQSLKNPILQDLQLQSPKFNLLDPAKYNAKKITEEVLKDHPSLIPFNTMVSTYDDILDDAEDLEVPGEDQYEGQISQAQKDVQEVQEKLDAEKAKPIEQQDPAVIAKLTEELGIAKGLLGAAEAQYSEAKKGRGIAEEDLIDYYIEELDEAKVRLYQHQDRLQLLSYHYETQFNLLKDKTELYEENLEKVQSLYEKTQKTYDQGLITLTDVEEVRLNVQQSRLQLLNTKKEYMVLKEEFRLFKEGYMPTSAGQ
ncbi:TolC family protein [Bacillus solimangrovi]|uniref:Transporter n=1 Tax=Bacillus solimangrovi TaxID=1305675 RepID=A0A1E5LDL4_9BACI|nr:TolC family protein [Bacillus solimangrovi]OEH92175.1 hypothetical protein BFG57_02580 [Bacillus solimangrovi]